MGLRVVHEDVEPAARQLRDLSDAAGDALGLGDVELERREAHGAQLAEDFEPAGRGDDMEAFGSVSCLLATSEMGGGGGVSPFEWNSNANAWPIPPGVQLSTRSARSSTLPTGGERSAMLLTL